jgi:hypothetical protein
MSCLIRIPLALFGVLAAIFGCACMFLPAEALSGKTYHETLTGIGLLGTWVYPTIFVAGLILALIAANYPDSESTKPGPEPKTSSE